MHSFETQCEQRAPFKTAQGLGVDYCAFRAGAAGNYHFSIYRHIVGNGGAKAFTGLADLRSQVLIETDTQPGADRQIDHGGRRRRRWRGRRRAWIRSAGSRGLALIRLRGLILGLLAARLRGRPATGKRQRARQSGRQTQFAIQGHRKSSVGKE